MLYVWMYVYVCITYALLSGNASFPLQQIHGAVVVGHWTSPETVRVVSSPRFSLLHQSLLCQAGHCVSLCQSISNRRGGFCWVCLCAETFVFFHVVVWSPPSKIDLREFRGVPPKFLNFFLNSAVSPLRHKQANKAWSARDPPARRGKPEEQMTVVMTHLWSNRHNQEPRE